MGNLLQLRPSIVWKRVSADHWLPGRWRIGCYGCMPLDATDHNSSFALGKKLSKALRSISLLLTKKRLRLRRLL